MAGHLSNRILMSFGYQFRSSCFQFLHWPPCASEISISAFCGSGATQFGMKQQTKKKGWMILNISICIINVLLYLFEMFDWNTNCKLYHGVGTVHLFYNVNFLQLMFKSALDALPGIYQSDDLKMFFELHFSMSLVCIWQ